MAGDLCSCKRSFIPVVYSSHDKISLELNNVLVYAIISNDYLDFTWKMNERLKEIMLERGLHKHISEDCQHRMEMLAELIVRECMNICKKHPSRDLDNLWTADAVAPDLVHQFEEHFGVEE